MRRTKFTKTKDVLDSLGNTYVYVCSFGYNLIWADSCE